MSKEQINNTEQEIKVNFKKLHQAIQKASQEPKRTSQAYKILSQMNEELKTMLLPENEGGKGLTLKQVSECIEKATSVKINYQTISLYAKKELDIIRNKNTTQDTQSGPNTDN